MRRQVRGIKSQDCFRPKFTSTLTLGGTGSRGVRVNETDPLLENICLIFKLRNLCFMFFIN